MDDEKENDFIKNLKYNTKKVLEILSENDNETKKEKDKSDKNIDIGEKI